MTLPRQAQTAPENATDGQGRRLYCVACKGPLLHKKGGRPRILCGQALCRSAWRRIRGKR